MRCKHIIYPFTRIEIDDRGRHVGGWKPGFGCLKCTRTFKRSYGHGALKDEEILNATDFEVLR